SGNGYAYIVRERGIPVELLLLQNAQVFPEIVKGQLRYRVTGRSTTISPSDMIHIKGLGFNGYQGLDPIRYYAKEVLGLAIATQNYAARYYENGGTPSAYLKSEIPLTDDQFNRLKGEAGPLKRSADNPHELPVLEMTDIKSVGLTAEQTQLLSARKDIVLDIANLLGIPPHKLGLAISTSYGSLEEENDAFRDDALDPWLVQFEMEYRKLLLEDEQSMETHSVSADRSEFSRMKSADQAQYISSLTGSAPTMTVNEGRRQLGLPPIEGGDELMKPMNMGNVGGGNANNFQPTAEAPEEETAAEESTEAEELSDNLPLQEARQRAMEDVFRRMSKRLATAASRIKRPEQLEEFRSRLDTDHLPTITAALTPIVPLCGGTDAGPIATAMVAEFRSRLGVTNAIESLDAIANQFMEEAGAFASEALRKMVA
ncbi:MAG TPA: phage portal protein, partial [Planctomycetaceae bacterium]|nr:phage portal protein [Planctomycetaceae bacterium]